MSGSEKTKTTPQFSASEPLDNAPNHVAISISTFFLVSGMNSLYSKRKSQNINCIVFTDIWISFEGISLSYGYIIGDISLIGVNWLQDTPRFLNKDMVPFLCG